MLLESIHTYTFYIINKKNPVHPCLFQLAVKFIIYCEVSGKTVEKIKKKL